MQSPSTFCVWKVTTRWECTRIQNKTTHIFKYTARTIDRASPCSHMQTYKWAHRKPCSDSVPQWFKFRMAKECSWLRVSTAAPTLPVQLCVCVQVCVYMCVCGVCSMSAAAVHITTVLTVLWGFTNQSGSQHDLSFFLPVYLNVLRALFMLHVCKR